MTVIINGTDTRMPIGYIYAMHGARIPLYSTDPSDVAQACVVATGSYPPPILFGPGSQLVIEWPQVPTGASSTPQLMIDTSGGEANKLLMDKWQAEVQAWHQRYKLMQEQAEAIIRGSH